MGYHFFPLTLLLELQDDYMDDREAKHFQASV